MLERNEKGKQVRRYFIQIEKKYKENTFENLSPELRAVIVVDQRITSVEKKVEHLEYDIPLYGSEADELCNHVKRKGVDMLGGKKETLIKILRYVLQCTLIFTIRSKENLDFMTTRVNSSHTSH